MQIIEKNVTRNLQYNTWCTVKNESYMTARNTAGRHDLLEDDRIIVDCKIVYVIFLLYIIV